MYRLWVIIASSTWKDSAVPMYCLPFFSHVLRNLWHMLLRNLSHFDTIFPHLRLSGFARIKWHNASTWNLTYARNLLKDSSVLFLSIIWIFEDNGKSREIRICCVIRELLLLSAAVLCWNTVSYHGRFKVLFCISLSCML